MKDIREFYNKHRLRILSSSLIVILIMAIALVFVSTNQYIEEYKDGLKGNASTGTVADPISDIDTTINSINEDNLPASDLSLQALGLDGTTVSQDTEMDKSLTSIDSDITNPVVLGAVDIQSSQN